MEPGKESGQICHFCWICVVYDHGEEELCDAHACHLRRKCNEIILMG